MAILRNLSIATAGTLPHDTSHIRRWTEANGGAYHTSLKPTTTHLITSKDAFKAPLPAVQHASDLGIWIVSFDWFDDSLQARRKLSEKRYTWESLRREKKKRKQIKRLGTLVDGKRFREGCEGLKRLTGSGTSKQSKGGDGGGQKKKSKSFFFGDWDTKALDTPFASATEDLARRRREREAVCTDGNVAMHKSTATPISATYSFPKSPHSPPTTVGGKQPITPSSSSTQAKNTHWKDLYHYYLDCLGFEYKITLMRSDLSINSFARYAVGLLESHTKPHTYCVLVQYTPPVQAGHDAPTPSNNPSYQGGIPRDLAASILTLHKPTAPTSQTKLPYNHIPTNTISEAPHLTPPITSLLPPGPPPANLPFKSIITPPHTSFSHAFRVFRHTFRDLTLLPWEDRFSPVLKATQAAHAQALGVEPFVYKKPAPGMPMGLMPQVVGVVDAPSGEADGYTRNAYLLPGLEEALSSRGPVGAALLRAEMEREKEREGERVAGVRGEEERREKRENGRTGNPAGPKRVNYNKPFFNGVQGAPVGDAGRMRGSAGAGAGAGAGTDTGLRQR